MRADQFSLWWLPDGVSKGFAVHAVAVPVPSNAVVRLVRFVRSCPSYSRTGQPERQRTGQPEGVSPSREFGEAH
jgi:hypothetical protein